MAIVAAAIATVVTPLWIIMDEFGNGPGEWFPGAEPVIGNGLFPSAVLAIGVVAFYFLLKKYFSASRNETVQALFVLLVVSFTILTVTGIWFRGAGMALVWPWQI